MYPPESRQAVCNNKTLLFLASPWAAVYLAVAMLSAGSTADWSRSLDGIEWESGMRSAW